MRTRSTATIAIAAVLALGLAGCASDSMDSGTTAASPAAATSQEAARRDLTGEWEQTGAAGEGNASIQSATIVDDTITVYWINDGEKALYWAGTAELPESAEGSFTFDSENDTSKTDTALLASSDNTKTFTFEGETLSYEVSALGTTWTAELQQTSSTPAAAPAADEPSTSDVAVTIGGASFSEDYEGAPVIVVDFEFTNGSEETTNFMTSTQPQAFQGGVELDSYAYVEDIDSSATMTDLKPGASISVQVPFTLRDESPVMVEVSELFSLDGALLDSQEFDVTQ
ncbi:DUF5067 domain-containing protein [Citricoccus muralis]|uniref:Uncharacterized protein DUF5067 n=1 Tax=Citricoccus muralis TaxID=169134 RepID=A0A3D9LEC9_9MICC|nr:DUF5067 domain-containing protein [Citricoccus muralis]REE04801.1 uncharacterized protein DUF5067 [Citricoccus muralis]